MRRKRGRGERKGGAGCSYEREERGFLFRGGFHGRVLLVEVAEEIVEGFVDFHVHVDRRVDLNRVHRDVDATAENERGHEKREGSFVSGANVSRRWDLSFGANCPRA